jgi:hypothetical protein
MPGRMFYIAILFSKEGKTVLTIKMVLLYFLRSLDKTAQWKKIPKETMILRNFIMEDR